MKSYAFLIFFSVVFAVYFLVNLYIYRHGISLFPKGSNLRCYFAWIFWSIAICFPLGRIVERFWISSATDLIIWVGSFWLAAMLYLFIAVLAIDILRLSNLAYPWMDHLFGDNLSKVKLWSAVGIASTVFLVVAAGHINAVATRVSHYNLTINKKGEKLQHLRIVATSDIHMGTIIGKRRVSRLINLINKQNPDIILFAGDIMDEDLGPVIRRNLGAKLNQLHSKYGTYAILGNHEYIGGSHPALKYMEEHGVKVLKDSSTIIDGSFYIVGRDDRNSRQFEHTTRKSVSELVDPLDHSKLIVLMDHQPYDLGKAEEAKVDIQLSGHTHHGQLWPLNYITQSIFELSSGYKEKGDSHIFVMNGYGTWGPPVRIGNRPEIVVLDITFKP